jgi:hypothetical protein
MPHSPHPTPALLVLPFPLHLSFLVLRTQLILINVSILSQKIANFIFFRCNYHGNETKKCTLQRNAGAEYCLHRSDDLFRAIQ